MGIKKYKPSSPGRRFMTSADYDEITSSSPYKPLLVSSHRKKGNTYKHGNNNSKLNKR